MAEGVCFFDSPRDGVLEEERAEIVALVFDARVDGHRVQDAQAVGGEH